MDEIEEELNEYQFKRLLFYMSDKISKTIREKFEINKDFLGLFEILKERGFIKPPTNDDIGESQYLIETLKRVKREDLAYKISCK